MSGRQIEDDPLVAFAAKEAMRTGRVVHANRDERGESITYGPRYRADGTMESPPPRNSTMMVEPAQLSERGDPVYVPSQEVPSSYPGPKPLGLFEVFAIGLSSVLLAAALVLAFVMFGVVPAPW